MSTAGSWVLRHLRDCGNLWVPLRQLAQPFGFLLLLLFQVSLALFELVVYAGHAFRFSRLACRFSFIVLWAFFLTFFRAFIDFAMGASCGL